MRLHCFAIPFILFFAGAYPVLSQEVALNEVMASNSETAADEDGDFNDWIELYNYGSEAVDLEGFGLSDRPDEPFRWSFPAVSLPAGAYMIVWASGKDRSDPQAPLHSNFSISSAGEPVLLTRPDGLLVDAAPEVPYQTDVSFGRQPDGSGPWSYFYEPTPGTSNTGIPFTALLSPPEFSIDGGFFTEQVTVSITHDHPNAEIVYTLDGSEPKSENAGGFSYTYRNNYPFGAMLTNTYETLPYTESLTLEDRSGDPNKVSAISSTNDFNPFYLPSDPVKKATVLKARAYVNGVPGPIRAATYVISNDNAFDSELPLISLSFDEDLLFDYEDGNYVAGKDFVEEKGGLICSWGNYNRRGIETEAFGHLQYFENGSLKVNQGIGLRLQGNCSRQNAFKGTRIYARSAYDAVNVIDYPFFSDEITHAQNPDNTLFKRLSMRGPNYYDLAFSRLYHSVYEGIGGRIQPAFQMINGEFWGLTFLRDRFDTHHIANHFDVDPDNVAMVKVGYRHDIEGGPFSFNDRMFYLSSGQEADMDAFWDLWDLITEQDMADSALYEQAKDLLDMDSFTDHLILKIFAGDSHYAPEYVFWKTGSVENDGQGDGRWRAYVKDFDDACFSTNNYVEAIAEGTHPRPFGYELFEGLLDNEEFGNHFINRFADLLNTHFLTHRFDDIIEDAFDEVSPYWAEAVARWGSTNLSNPSRPFDVITKNALLAWSAEHPDRQRDHLAEFFNLSSQIQLTLDVSAHAHGYIRVNTVDIHPATPGTETEPYPWQGVYFTDVPLNFTAVPAPGYVFAGWEGDTEANAASFTQGYDQETVWLKANFIEDESLSNPPEAIHYWHFNQVSGVLTEVAADTSVTEEPGLITYPGSGDGFKDDVNEGSDINLLHGEEPGRALRVRNPSIDRHLLIEAPTEGYANIVLRYAARRTNNGAEMQYLSYRTDEGGAYTLFDSAAVGTDHALYEWDFSDLSAANDNPHFAVRIDFGGENAAGSTGNNRFDNVSVSGTPGGGPLIAYFPLIEADFTFHNWPSDAEAGAYPGFMRFYRSTDPSDSAYDVFADGTGLYECGYNLNSRPRFNGLDESGFSFLSTGNPQFNDCNGGGALPERYVGSAVVALNTSGVEFAEMKWTAGLVTEGARRFAVRLQYRLGEAGPFSDLEQPTVYSSDGKDAGHSQTFSIALPQMLMDVPALQLRFVYYQEAGEGGNRPEIRIDDITVSGGPCPAEGGTLLAPENRSFCIGTGTPSGISVEVVGASGTNQRWALIDEQGDVKATRITNSHFNLDAFPAGDYEIRYIRYEDNLTNLADITNTSQVGELDGCYSISGNGVNIYLREPPLGGYLSAAGPTHLCEGEGEVLLNVSGNTGEFGRFGLVPQGGNQEIIASNSDGAFDTGMLPEGTYIARHLSYQQGVNLSGMTQISQLEGCYAFSGNVFIHITNCASATLAAMPNPAAEHSLISFSTPVQGYTTVEVYGMSGRLIKRLFAQEAVSEHVYTRDFSAAGLPAGVYLIRLSTPNEVRTEKLLVGRP